MANFAPWRQNSLQLLDILIDVYGSGPPFLDVGCGLGDLTAHLARRGWRGTALDLSWQAVEATRRAVEGKPFVRVMQRDVRELDGLERFGTICAFDVLEHVQDDAAFLRHLAQRLAPHGALVLAVPVKASEWRWDDDFYGHHRRYEPDQLDTVCRQAGLRIVENWDCTWPFLWLMRRAYTRLLSPAALNGNRAFLTLHSAAQSAWDRSSILTQLAEHALPWSLLTRIQWRFRRSARGCERIIFARRLA